MFWKKEKKLFYNIDEAIRFVLERVDKTTREEAEHALSLIEEHFNKWNSKKETPGSVSGDLYLTDELRYVLKNNTMNFSEDKVKTVIDVAEEYMRTA